MSSRAGSRRRRPVRVRERDGAERARVLADELDLPGGVDATDVDDPCVPVDVAALGESGDSRAGHDALEVANSDLSVRYGIAIVLAGAAVAAALVLASLHLNTHPSEPFAIINSGGLTGQINGPAQIPFWTAVREGITPRPAEYEQAGRFRLPS